MKLTRNKVNKVLKQKKQTKRKCRIKRKPSASKYSKKAKKGFNVRKKTFKKRYGGERKSNRLKIAGDTSSPLHTDSLIKGTDNAEGNPMNPIHINDVKKPEEVNVDLLGLGELEKEVEEELEKELEKKKLKNVELPKTPDGKNYDDVATPERKGEGLHAFNQNENNSKVKPKVKPEKKTQDKSDEKKNGPENKSEEKNPETNLGETTEDKSDEKKNGPENKSESEVKPEESNEENKDANETPQSTNIPLDEKKIQENENHIKDLMKKLEDIEAKMAKRDEKSGTDDTDTLIKNHSGIKHIVDHIVNTFSGSKSMYTLQQQMEYWKEKMSSLEKKIEQSHSEISKQGEDKITKKDMKEQLIILNKARDIIEEQMNIVNDPDMQFKIKLDELEELLNANTSKPTSIDKAKLFTKELRKLKVSSDDSLQTSIQEITKMKEEFTDDSDIADVFDQLNKILEKVVNVDNEDKDTNLVKQGGRRTLKKQKKRKRKTKKTHKKR